jgi:hypothetical protein
MAHHQVPEQAVDAVLELTSKGIEVADAVMVVRSKNPSAFGSPARGFNPTAHATATPTSGRIPPPAEPTRLEQVTAIPDLHVRHDTCLKEAAQMIRKQAFGQPRTNGPTN